jgi:glutamyl-tRNA synthetase
MDPIQRQKVHQVVEACGDRIKLASDILLYGAYFFRDPQYDPQAVEKRLKKPEVPKIMDEAQRILRDQEPFDAKTLETRMHQYCQENNLKPGDLNHILRVATTGVAIGPGVFECLAILGKKETLRRFELARKEIEK